MCCKPNLCVTTETNTIINYAQSIKFAKVKIQIIK